MINQFREQMPRPIVGIGHSMGATELFDYLLSSLSLLLPQVKSHTYTYTGLAWHFLLCILVSLRHLYL